MSQFGRSLCNFSSNAKIVPTDSKTPVTQTKAVGMNEIIFAATSYIDNANTDVFSHNQLHSAAILRPRIVPLMQIVMLVPPSR